MKIELKHLAPYLPYELTFVIENETEFSTNGFDVEFDNDNYIPNGVYQLTGINYANSYLPDCVMYKAIHHTDTSRDGYAQITDTKPILRPLSDLTKKIEVNGEKFVPLQKLCRLFAYNEQYKKDWIFNSEENYAFNGGRNRNNFNKELIYFCSASDPIMTIEFGYYSISKKFYLKDNRDKEDLTYVVNQYDAMQKLFEWHFDVFGLIEAGLAIDFKKIK